MYSEQVEKASKSINERVFGQKNIHIFWFDREIIKKEIPPSKSHSLLKETITCNTYCLIFRDNDSKIVICVLRPKTAPFSSESEFSGRGAAEA
jgi:hypothetical protein